MLIRRLPGRSTALISSLVLGAAALAVASPAQAAGCKGSLSGPAGYDLYVRCPTDGSGDIHWSVTKDDAGELGSGALGEKFTVTIHTGRIVPRVAFTHGAGVSVQRNKLDDGHWDVVISAEPVLLLGECDQQESPWKCPQVATQQWDALLDGDITDYGTWEDVAQREAFFGMDFSTNIAATTIPPQIVNDPNSDAQMILLELSNPHFLKSAPTTVFEGFAHVRIPNAFLKEVYGVDTPSTLTSAGLDPALSSGGAGTVTVSDVGTALVVDVEDMTFSNRTVKIKRGTITPRKPTNLAAARTGSTTAKLTFRAATARGSKVTGHAARCVARTGTHVVTDKELNGPPQYIAGLRKGVAYDCKVRGLSKAGGGAWTATVRVPKA